ncbi:integrase-like protein [Mucilaginibacter gracilis]|uniref:Integrase-like protein n=1 Tax=Mucilaginibacter gracilis TaxID=423350 RepID=A0A495J283_9SPHI|nr:phage integrase SAM-like domain and Arm DNA-binding domain-containing protein [Mucilaginibacter gracilis]RKR82923.1 integrase-like protein [Mucilaginibacter gracilis]
MAINTTNNTFGVAFYLKKQKTTQAGKLPIYARMTVNGKRIEISVKRSIEEHNWNATKGMAKGSREGTVKVNKYLDQFKAGIIDSYQQLLLQKKFITAELLKEKVTGSDQAEFTICKLMEYHNSDQGQLLEPGTMKNYYTTQKYIKEFIKERFKTSDKYLSELSYKFITDFEYYLRNRTPEKGQKRLNNNGLMKHIERFCKMINLAVRLEWIDRDPFHAYQLKFDKVEREYLTKDELAGIEAKKFNIVRLQVVLSPQIFFFSL